MTDYQKLAPVVKTAYRDFEAKTAEAQKTMEARYLKTVKTNPKAADKLLNDFNIKVLKDAEALTENLTNELFTIARPTFRRTSSLRTARRRTDSFD